MRDRRALNVSLLLRPFHRTFDRSNQIAAGTGCQRHRVIIYPLLDVVRAELFDRERPLDGLAERFDPVFVPTVGVWRPMLFTPVQELIEDDDSQMLGGECRRYVRLLGVLLHQAVVSLECRRLIVAKIDLFPVDLDVPEAAGRSEERFWKVRH